MFLEPGYCAIVRDQIEQENIPAAVHTLLQHSEDSHRSVVQLRQQVVRLLLGDIVEQISQLKAQSSSIDEIDDMLGRCTKLRELPRDVAAVKEKVAIWKRQRELRQRLDRRRHQEAKRMAAAGRMFTAIQRLPDDSCDDDLFIENEMLKTEWQREVDRLDKKLDQVEQLLDNGHPMAAHELWQQTAGVNRLDPRVVELKAQIDADLRRSRVRPPVQTDINPVFDGRTASASLEQEISSGDCMIVVPSSVVDPRETDSFIPVSDKKVSSSEDAILQLTEDEQRHPVLVSCQSARWILAMGPTLTIGGCRDASAPRMPHRVQLLSRLRKDEVQLKRTSDGFRLAVGSATRGCYLNGQLLAGETQTPIQDGDCLELDSGRLRFDVRCRRPGCLVLEVDARTPIRERRSQLIHGIALMDDTISVGAKDADCRGTGEQRSVTIYRDRYGLRARSLDRVVWWERPPEDNSDPDCLGSLRVEPMAGGAAGLMDIFSGYGAEGQTFRFEKA